jgi:Fur family peroxide stress response transcriptional regulator
MIYNNNMKENTVITRNTKYTDEVISLLNKKNHLTNLEILDELKKTYPDLTPTTVHRITSRFISNGILAEAPTNKKGDARFDINIKPHDHFVCKSCGNLRDIDVAESVIPELNKALGNCRVTGRIVINGSCDKCIKKGESL